MSPVSSDLTAMTLAEARDAIRARKISSRELTAAFVTAIEKARALNAFITEAGEQALLAADRADSRIAKGEAGALEGLPLAIKDLFCTKGVRTTAASKILGNFVPPYESTVTQNLWDAGAVMLGKTNLD
ncbi:MAG TPA: amidase family protein, partial [Rhizomicrobium sp.]